MKKQMLASAVLASLGAVVSLGAQAATVNNGDILHISSGIPNTGYVTGGSYYGVDTNGNSQITTPEKAPLVEGTTGLVIGVISYPGAYHPGAPTASDTNAVTAPDFFNGSTGSWYSTSPITGNTTNGLNMSGWNWAWNTLSSIPMGSGAWQPGNCAALGCTGYTFTNGVGRFQWDGVYGHAYLLDYTSTIAAGDPSGLGGFQFYVHLEGTVAAAPVPIPAAIWLFGSGLLGLLGMTRLRKPSV